MVPISAAYFGRVGGVGIKIGTGGYGDGGSSERIASKPEAVETITTDVLDLGTCISERTRKTGVVQRAGEERGANQEGAGKCRVFTPKLDYPSQSGYGEAGK